MLEDDSDPNDSDFIVSYKNKDETPIESSESDCGNEDTLESFEFKIKDSVPQFMDELLIFHYVYLDSESDSKYDDMLVEGREYNRVKQIDEKLAYWQVFCSSIMFKENILDYALKT